MVERPCVVWDLSASRAFQRHCAQIRQDSPQNAQRVQQGIIDTVDQLPQHPERYPLDKFKQNNPGNYRAFEQFSLRVAYRHTKKEIRILRCRHVKQRPQSY